MLLKFENYASTTENIVDASEEFETLDCLQFAIAMGVRDFWNAFQRTTPIQWVVA